MSLAHTAPERQKEMEQYKQELRAFMADRMPDKQDVLIFGEGPKQPKLMLIGEAPGEQETLQGRPFVGKAGKNLDRFLELARKAALYDGIISYTKNSRYLAKEDILAFAGEDISEEDNDDDI